MITATGSELSAGQKKLPNPVRTYIHLRGPWYTCRVCGRRHDSRDILLPYQRALKVCSFCCIWWAKESRKRLNQLAEESTWTEDTEMCEIENWNNEMMCVLPEGHVGPHIAADPYGVAVDVWTGDFDR